MSSTVLKGDENIYIKAYLENLLKNYNSSNLECEFRSGITTIPAFGKNENAINQDTFRKIIEFFDLLSNKDSVEGSKDFEIKKIPIKNTLDIEITTKNSEKNLDLNMKNLRFTLTSKDAIRDYCSTNILPKGKSIEILYKDSLVWKEHELREDIEKIGYQTHNNKCIVDLESLRTRLSGKIELRYENGEFKTDKKLDPYFQDLHKKATNVYTNYRKHNFNLLYKTYRLKERCSYKIIYKNRVIWIDLTKVKSSKKDNKGFSIPVQNFIDSDIASQNPSYEYEIEFNFAKKSVEEELEEESETSIIEQVNSFYENVINFVINDIYIPSIEFSSVYPTFTPFHVQNDIKSLYNKTVLKMLLKRIDYKLSIIKRLEKYNSYKSDLTKEGAKQFIDEADIEFKDLPYSFFELIKYKSKHDIRSLDDELNKRKNDIINSLRYNRFSSKFISPKVVSIELNNLRSENINSICHDYTVTDKADGLNMLLFKVGLEDFGETDIERYSEYNDYLYLIDTNFRVYQTKLKNKHTPYSYIFNGEYIKNDAKGNLLNKYGIFDCYLNNGTDVCGYELMSNDDTKITRITTIENYLKDFLDNSKNDKDFGIFLKNFYIADYKIEGDIFNKSRVIWENYTSGKENQKINRYYTLDGLIYTPANLPVGYDPRGINNYYYDLSQHITWKMNLKWKPPRDNTIDFLLRYEKEEIHSYKGKSIYKDSVKKLMVNKESETSFAEYKIANLYCGMNMVYKGNPCKRSSNDYYKNNVYKPALFKPTNPYIVDIYQSLLETKDNLCYDEDGHIIDDNTIVEVAYSNFDKQTHGIDYEDNPNLRWKILRTRHDKTFQYRNAIQEQKQLYKTIKEIIGIVNTVKSKKLKYSEKDISLFNNPVISRTIYKILNKTYRKDDHIDIILEQNIDKLEENLSSYEDIPVSNINFGNNYEIANNIWLTIHNPVTVQMITTGKTIPSIDEEEEKYYNNDHTWERSKSVTIQMQNLHNKVIKNRILLNNVSRYLRSQGNLQISLLDLACGKGSDIAKWRDNELSICVGIDSVSNNILDKTDGACQRYNFYKERARTDKKLPEIHFLKGDASKDIIEGKSITDINFVDQFKDLWGIGGKNFSQNGFDIISIMFAIHYFFESKDKLDGLINNISNNLKKGGFLIGACFDGKRIFEIFNSKTLNDNIKSNKSGKLIWKIVKKYTNIEFNDDETSLGKQIDVLIYTINKSIPEWLVNFDYLIKRLEEVGIKQLTTDEVKKYNMDLPNNQSIGSFNDVFKSFSKIPKESDGYELYQELLKYLSKEEQEFSFLFNYFIFRKTSQDEENIEKIIKFVKQNENIYADLFNKSKKGYEQEVKKSIKSKTEFGFDDTIYDDAIKSIAVQIKAGKFNLVKAPKKPRKPIIKKEKSVVESVQEPSVEVVEKEPSVESGKPAQEPLVKVVEKEPSVEAVEADKPAQESAQPVNITIKESGKKRGIKKPTVKKSSKDPKTKFLEIYDNIKSKQAAFEKANPLIKAQFVMAIDKLLKEYDNTTNRANVDIGPKIQELKLLKSQLNK